MFYSFNQIKLKTMIRCIVYSNENGSREGVFFTEDLEMNSDDCIPPSCTLDHDFVIDTDFPTSFPMEYNLEKNY